MTFDQKQNVEGAENSILSGDDDDDDDDGGDEDDDDNEEAEAVEDSPNTKSDEEFPCLPYQLLLVNQTPKKSDEKLGMLHNKEFQSLYRSPNTERVIILNY